MTYACNLAIFKPIIVGSKIVGLDDFLSGAEPLADPALSCFCSKSLIVVAIGRLYDGVPICFHVSALVHLFSTRFVLRSSIFQSRVSFSA